MIYGLYSIEPSPDSAPVRLDVWALQSCRETESARRIATATKPARHFNQVDGRYILVHCPYPWQTSTSTRPVSALKNMNNTFPSLITSDSKTGLAPAGNLADQLQSQIDQARSKLERPGGMNYLLPAQVPKEITASILFYAIAAANQGWPIKG